MPLLAELKSFPPPPYNDVAPDGAETRPRSFGTSHTYTTVDTDEQTFWTIQQYGDTRNDPLLPDAHYGLWIAKVKRN
jgi:hypothetical protein